MGLYDAATASLCMLARYFDYKRLAFCSFFFGGGRLGAWLWDYVGLGTGGVIGISPVHRRI